MAFRGIDIAQTCGKIDFKKLKNSGYGDFVIIHIGYGQNYTQQDDKRIDEYVKGCNENNIPYGLYLYSYADTLEKAKSERNHLERIIREHKLKPTLGCWYDIEDRATYIKKFKSEYSKSCSEFLDRICKDWYGLVVGRNWGGGVYASDDFFKNVFPKNNFWKYGIPKWVAAWGNKKGPLKNPPKYEQLVMWQDRGSNYNGIKVDGTKCNNDTDFYYGNKIK